MKVYAALVVSMLELVFMIGKFSVFVEVEVGAEVEERQKKCMCKGL